MVYTYGIGVRRTINGAIVLIAISILVVGGIPLPLLQRTAYAASTCQIVSISPRVVPTNSDNGFAINISDASNNIAWVHIASPSPNLTIATASSDFLPNTTFTSDHADFSGNPISSGTNIELDIGGLVSNFQPSTWSIFASTNQNGTGAYACEGDASISVQNSTPPNITNISATAQATTATITWQSDTTTTASADYGLSSSYGSNVTDNNPGTGHSVTLTGLSASTVYHYRVNCTDQTNLSSSSIDGTFRTAAIPTSTTVNPVQPVPIPIDSKASSPIGIKVTTPSDTKPPSITISTILPKVVTSEPTITGVADDDVALAKIEYSTDGGNNWLTVDKATGLDSKHASFSFTPINLDDGTYKIVARATDAGGNTAISQTLQVILDRKPPTVGAVVIALGPQVLTPDAQNIIYTIPSVELSLTTSSTGGTTNLDIQALNANNTDSGVAADFTLKQSTDSGLWNGTLSFTKTGLYQLVTKAVDGAGNTTTRALLNVLVKTPGRTLAPDGPVKHSTVTAYYLDTDTNSWSVWDGTPYGQTNPQTTDVHGAFKLLLPAGTYYLHASAPGYYDVNSQSFDTNQPSAITTVLYAQRAPRIGPWQMPLLWFSAQNPAQGASSQALPTSLARPHFVGSSLSNATYTDLNGHPDSTIDWLGKPTLVTVMTDWAPMTTEQVPILEHLATNPDIRIKVIGLQASAARLRAYNAIAASGLTWLADPDNLSLKQFPTGSVPTHYLLDRKGVIRHVAYGVLSYDELLDNLTNLP